MPFLSPILLITCCGPELVRKWESGFDLGTYAYTDLPTGSRNIVLEASTWNPTQPAVICFFLDLDSNQRYRLSVFRNRKTDRYGPGELDLSGVAPGEKLQITIHQNGTGSYRLLEAKRAT